ncbi:MAG: hypothetical protein IPN90_09860 [Elusimicrobia bacterium]|nr:hypothetical protein [Elusimicrobiota bacterium]
MNSRSNTCRSKATVDLVDESRAGSPSLQLRADISVTRRWDGGGVGVKVSGQLAGERGSGNFMMEGRTGDGGDLRFNAARIPVGLVAEFVPALSPWAGSFSVNGSIFGSAGQREWKIDGHMEDLRIASTDQRLPLRLDWTVQSGSSATVRAVWTSTTTRVAADVLLPDLRVPEISVSIKGDRLDLGEFTELFSSLPSVSSGSVSGIAPWTLAARVELESLIWRQWAVKDVRLRSNAGPTKGRVSDLSFSFFKGTVTASGDWRAPKREKKGWALTGTMETDGVDVGELAQVMGSTVPWGGRFSGKVRVKDFPVQPDESMDIVSLLRSIPLAEVLQASGTATHVGTETWFFDEAGVVLNQERRKGLGTLRCFGVQGVSSVTVVAQWPIGLENKIAEERTSLFVRGNIDALDLDVVETLFPTLGVRGGRGWASGEWRSEINLKSPKDYFFGPTAQWGGYVRVSSADWKGVDLSEVQGRLEWSDGVLRASDVGGQAAGGSLTLQAELRGVPQEGPLTFSINGKFKDIETKEIVAAISTSAYLVKGRFSGGIDLAGPLHPWNPAGLNGSVAFIARDGEFLTSPTVLSVFSALKINSLLRSMEGKKEVGLPFDVFEASGPIRSGRYILDKPLLLKNGAFQLAYTGWMDVRFMTARGTVLFNFLQGTSNVISKIPVVSSLVLGQDGELIPLVVDVVFENGETSVTPRSIKTLTGPLVSVVKNVFKFPFTIFSPKKKPEQE